MIDKEAHAALWRAICDAAEKLSRKYQIFFSIDRKYGLQIDFAQTIPDVDTWQLVEAISMLMILTRADAVISTGKINLFGRNGPLHFIEERKDRFLWSQFLIVGKESDLGGRPDLVITKTKNKPSSEEILRIIECKCRKHIGAREIRAEFGKAFDLKVKSYLIWSFLTPSPGIVEGAKKLGIDLASLGFDSPRRGELLSRPEILQAHISNTIEYSKREERFAMIVIEGSKEIAKKT